jgi:hypothetical protein
MTTQPIAGAEVLIWGGVSHTEHGRILSIETGYERPFALVCLRRKDGQLSKRETLVPLSRCFELPAYVLRMQQEERDIWIKKWSPKVTI